MTLSRAQRDAGSSVEFVTFKGKKFGSQVRAEGFVTHEVRNRTKIDPLSILHMRRLIKDGRFDVVHTHLSTSSVNGCLAARAAKIPCVATVHGMSSRISFAAANHLIAVSEGIKQHLIAQGSSADQVTVVYNGFDLQDRGLLTKRKHDTFPVLGTVSRVTPLKGIEDAIRAVGIVQSDYPDVTYLVVGDGVGVEPCKALALELGLEDKVKFVGYRKDIEAYLAQMDLFVFPSLKEGMGLALVEAMAMGLATVATNVGGIPEVITPECGTLVPPNSPAELAKAISALLHEDPRRLKMEAAAQSRAESVFSVEAMRSQTEAVYRSLKASK